jgi:two-component system, response regulator RegA
VQRVLLVDDKDLQLRAWSREMAKRGLERSVAENRAQALAAARMHDHQLAVVDLFLGSENGLNIIEALLKLDRTLPVVLVSADLPTKDAVYAMHAGAQWACEKPVDWNTVLAIAEGQPPPLPSHEVPPPDYDDRLKMALERALEMSFGNQSEAAQRLRMHRTTFRRRCEKLGIRLPWRPRGT